MASWMRSFLSSLRLDPGSPEAYALLPATEYNREDRQNGHSLPPADRIPTWKGARRRTRCLDRLILVSLLAILICMGALIAMQRRELAEMVHRFSSSGTATVKTLSENSTIAQVLSIAPTTTSSSTPVPTKLPPPPVDISRLDAITYAQWHLDSLFSRQSVTLEEASARYSLKTNRPPPKNYDRWFKFAREKKCLIDEYDQIHRDFAPFYQMVNKDPQFFAKRMELAAEIVRKEGIGMKTAQIRNGRYSETDSQGTSYNNDWRVTMGRFSHILPDMNFILNGRDEPRVLFDYRKLDVMDQAFKVSDSTPFKHEPKPTSKVFKDQQMCIFPNDPIGFTSPVNDANGFLIDSTSSDFTTDFFPMLSMTRITPCFADILVPSEYYYKWTWWYAKYRYANNVDWNNKKRQLYWRGHATGGHIHGNDYLKFPRFHLIDVARDHGDIMDVAITQLEPEHCGKDCDRAKLVKDYNIKGFDTPREDVYKYKWVFDVDGNTFSGRYHGLLRSGSLVFKSTVFSEFTSDWLIPNVHYIPVLPDLSDLVEKVKWAEANDAEAHRIQETGRLFAEKVLTNEQLDCYFAAVLLEWARLQDYAKTQGAS
ncbi:glycosyl transferase family 90-domain-containing protein [Mycena floridula]|nr:glycosyl transferase family 90-domain-containing protein [Mycena floridula]